MLHELLLSLSGHPSPLLRPDGQLDDALGTLISPSERALLHKLANLGALHNEVRSRAAAVGSSAPSVVCRAVAAAILETHLGRYQDKIIEIEKGILTSDSKLVAAYNNVPLSIIVVEFDGWPQILEWLKQLLDFVQASDVPSGSSTTHRTGAQVLAHLRTELRTGFPDLECVCLELLKVADAAWLRQLSSWLLYGKLPAHGAHDFFIQAAQNQAAPFKIIPELSPPVVTKATGESILFVGRSVHNLNSLLMNEAQATNLQSRPNLKAFLGENIKLLSSLDLPVSATALSRLVTSARSSLSRHALQKLLPTASILQTLQVVHEFLLLHRGEFALALVMTTDQHLAARGLKTIASGSKRDPQGIGGAMIKEAELSTILSKTWATLTIIQGASDDLAGDLFEDEELDKARDLISLEIARANPKSTEGSTSSYDNLFEDLLVGTPAALKLAIPSPLDLFLSAEEAEVYSQANALLLGVRRAHLHLTGLWRLSVLRRTHPGPIRPVNSATLPKLTGDRERAQRRNDLMRGVWAAVSSTSLFLVELGEYFQGEVVASSWAALQKWIRGPVDAQASTELELHDPETLALGHRRYLAKLSAALLLHDQPFARELRNLLGRVDYAVGLIQRLDFVVLTLMAGESAETAGPEHLQREEESLEKNLLGARRALETALATVAQRLKDIEAVQLETGMGSLAMTPGQDSVWDIDGASQFSPWEGAGLSQLTMKLEFANVRETHVSAPT